MKRVIRFQSNDGKIFDKKLHCLEYECKIELIKNIMQKLSPILQNDGCSFANGGGYIQHDKKTFLQVRKELLELAQKDCKHEWIQQSIDDPAVDPSWAGRIIGECCIHNLCVAWGRISCTDASFREWGQPYYRLHPYEGEQRKLNEVRA